MAGVILVIAAAGSGCTMLGSKDVGSLLEDDKPVAGEPASAYQVIFVPTNGKPSQVVRTLSGQMHIQDAIAQTGADKKFRRIRVELMRPLPSGGIHRVECDYDRATKRITPEFDYALLPGDKIIVNEDPSNLIDDMLKSALGPLGSKMSNKLQRRKELDNKYQVMR
jgi:hypothetical protein